MSVTPKPPPKGLSMSHAHVDPSELRRFAQVLKTFNTQLQGMTAGLHSQLTGLSQSWRDREHDKFAEEFEKTLSVITRFLETSEQHVPFLLRKAERAEEYMRQR